MSSPPFFHPPRVRRRLALGTAVALLACSNDSLDPDPSVIASVTVVPARLTLGVDASTPLTVEIRDAAGTLLQGHKVVWATNKPEIATVSSGGAVTGVSPGSVQIAASAGGKTAVADVTVTPKAVASIRLTPSGNVGLFVGQTRQMTAEALDAGGAVLPERAITWTSNATTVATVSATGLITGVGAGGAVITAASEGKTAVVAMTVTSVPVASVTVTPASDTVTVASTLQLSAVAKDAAGGTLTGRVISWSTSDPARATVSSTGLVTGVTPGEVTITAAAEGKSGAASITVKPKPVGTVVITPAQVSLQVGQTRQLSVQVMDDQGNVLTGRPVTFTTDGASIATVSATGLVTAIAQGSAKITATSEGKTGTADVTVTTVPVASVTVAPAQATLAIGQTIALTATARDASGNVLPGRPVSWTSGAPSVATVSPTGTVTAVGAGTGVLIFATVDGRTGTATINVRQVSSVAVTPSPTSVFVLWTRQLTATPRDATGNAISGLTPTWSANAPTVASVNQQGLVTGVAPGGTSIIAAYGSVTGNANVTVQLAPVASVTVTPNPASVKVGQTLPLTATLRDANNNILSLTGRTINWASNNTTRATVDQAGVVTGKTANTTPVTITATSGGVSGSSQVTVTP